MDGHSRDGRGIVPVSGDRFAKWNFDVQTQNIHKHATLTYSYFFNFKALGLKKINYSLTQEWPNI